MNEEKKTFYVGQVVRFKTYDGIRVGTIVATRVDHPDAYYIVWREPKEQWLESEKLEVETIETLKKYEEGKRDEKIS